MAIKNNKLYKVDEATNALIPVMQNGASEKEKIVESNQLYVLDPDTNARIPVVEIQGGNSGVTLPIEIADVNGLQEGLADKVNKETGKVLSTNDFTDAYKSQLDTNKADIADIIGSLDCKADLVDGKVPASQIPSYVDQIIEGELVSDTEFDVEGFIITPEIGKIYSDTVSNKIYRWGGSRYVETSAGIALGETLNTAYRGDRGKKAYDHSQTSGNPHSTTKADIGLGNVDNTSDINKPVSTAQQQAIEKAVDDIQIGGVNLLKNSNFTNGFNNWFTYGTITNTIVSDSTFGQAAKIITTNQGSGIYTIVTNQKVGDSFTLSAYAKADSPMTLFVSNESSDFPGGRKDIDVTTEWQRIFVTSKVLRVGSNGSNALSFYSSSATPSGTFYITNVKYEVNSNKPTNWTPALEDLQIGGTNLLPGTSNGIGWSYTRFNNNTFEGDTVGANVEKYIQSDNYRISLYSGQQLTISFEHKETSNTQSTEFFLLGSSPNINIQYPTSTTWKKESFTFTIPSGWGTIDNPITNVYARFDNNGSTNGQVSTLSVRNIKLEVGNKATDWSPAPEDIQAQLQALSDRITAMGG